MDENVLNELSEIANDFGSKSMQVRAEAAREATDFLAERGLSWKRVLGQVTTIQADQEPRGRSYAGFIPFTKDGDPLYDEVRGYALLMATREERQILHKLMAREDATMRDTTEDELKLIRHFRDEARRLRDLLANETFTLKSGRVCRLVVKND